MVKGSNSLAGRGCHDTFDYEILRRRFACDLRYLTQLVANERSGPRNFDSDSADSCAELRSGAVTGWQETGLYFDAIWQGTALHDGCRRQEHRTAHAR